MKKLLKSEIEQMKSLMDIHEADNVAIVNSDELDNTWSAKYHVNKKLGKRPYVCHDFKYIPCEEGKSIPKDAFYLAEKDANELNVLGNGVRDLLRLYNEKREALGLIDPSGHPTD
jgi:hypothetical protein